MSRTHHIGAPRRLRRRIHVDLDSTDALTAAQYMRDIASALPLRSDDRRALDDVSRLIAASYERAVYLSSPRRWSGVGNGDGAA